MQPRDDVSRPSISAVIPTVLRETLPRAIRSAKGQLGVDVQVIIVCDVDKIEEDQMSLLEGADIVLHTGGGRRGSYARNLGVSVATGQYVAFLDDDDEWLPSKSVEQINALLQHENHVVSCSITQEWHKGSNVVIPKRCIDPDQRVEDYLFSRRGPNIQRASLFTSTLLCETQVAKRFLWDENLSRHQDWEWLLTLQDGGVGIVQLNNALVTVHPDSPNSISASSDWSSSLIWVKRYKHQWSSSTYVDFLVSQTMRYALGAKSLRGVVDTLNEILKCAAMPSLPALATGIGGILPKSKTMRAMTTLASMSKYFKTSALEAKK